MCVRRVKNGETITVHSNSAKTEAGSRHYIHAKDVADAMLFLLNNDVTKKKSNDSCKVGHNIKFNIVGLRRLIISL